MRSDRRRRGGGFFGEHCLRPPSSGLRTRPSPAGAVPSPFDPYPLCAVDLTHISPSRSLRELPRPSRTTGCATAPPPQRRRPRRSSSVCAPPWRRSLRPRGDRTRGGVGPPSNGISDTHGYSRRRGHSGCIDEAYTGGGTSRRYLSQYHRRQLPSQMTMPFLSFVSGQDLCTSSVRV